MFKAPALIALCSHRATNLTAILGLIAFVLSHDDLTPSPASHRASHRHAGAVSGLQVLFVDLLSLVYPPKHEGAEGKDEDKESHSDEYGIILQA